MGAGHPPPRGIFPMSTRGEKCTPRICVLFSHLQTLRRRAVCQGAFLRLGPNSPAHCAIAAQDQGGRVMVAARLPFSAPGVAFARLATLWRSSRLMSFLRISGGGRPSRLRSTCIPGGPCAMGDKMFVLVQIAHGLAFPFAQIGERRTAAPILCNSRVGV